MSKATGGKEHGQNHVEELASRRNDKVEVPRCRVLLQTLPYTTTQDRGVHTIPATMFILFERRTQLGVVVQASIAKGIVHS